MILNQGDRVINTPQFNDQDFSWSFWPIVPIYPYGKRQTIRKEILKDTIWVFEQLQGILYVVVPIRMTVIKLNGGGLLVYAPVAPTTECLRLMQELITEHGDIKYIILPTSSGLEHKVFVGPFARCFPQAEVYVAPGQWSFPINLPLNWLGLPAKRTKILPEDSSKTPFGDRFDYAILGPLNLGLGKFTEVAFFDKKTKYLLLTDTIVSIPEEPPAILQLDPFPLLFHAKDNATEPITDTPANRRKGWQRIALFAMYFQPSVLDVFKWRDVFRDALKAPDRSKKAYFGLFPFKWRENWQRSFFALSGNGRLFVAPVLQTLILNRAPQETISWANRIFYWDFQKIIPCHFDAPINTTRHQFREAFTFLEKQPAISAGVFNSSTYPLPEEDFKVMQEIDNFLNKTGAVPPAKERV